MSSYKALYRKHRPQKFSEVSDQEYITRTLMNSIKLNRVSHAYLFNGPRGTGKTSIARIFAKAINCEHLNEAEPCDECDICKSINNGSNPDIIEIDAASRTRVEQMRETLEKVSYLPSMSKYKVYIIDECHMLTDQSWNALLKTLEEPPKHVIFILCTTDVEKVIPTIRSRCQRFDFQLIGKEAIENRLKYVVEEEHINIENEAITLIAEAAEGGMRDALSLLDQVSAFSINDMITSEDVIEVSGKLSTDVLIAIATCIKENDSSRSITLLDSLIKMGKEVEKITQNLISFYKDILVIKNANRKIEKLGYDKIEFNKIVVETTNQTLYKYIDILTEAAKDYRYSINKRLYLELAFIKMCDKQSYIEKGFVMPQVKKEESVFKPVEPKTIEPANKVVQEEIDKNTLNNQTQNQEINNETKLENEKEVGNDNIPAPVDFNFEEADNNDNDVVNDEPVQENINDESDKSDYDIHFIEEVLNNANKQFKEKLINELEDAKRESKGSPSHKYSLLLDGGLIAASSERSFIITFKEVGHCNLIMKDDNSDGVVKFIADYLKYKLNFIAIPFDLWKKMSDEYVRIYKMQGPNGGYIHLTKIEYPGLRILKKEVKNEEEDAYKGIVDLFGDDLKID